MTRCRFCGLSPHDVMRDVPAVGPSTVLANADIERCEYDEGRRHVFVHQEHPAYKEHPMTQYAAELDFRVRSCPDCMALTRYGATPKGRWEWFTSTTLRQHWRECDGGSKGSMFSVRQGVSELR